VHKKSKTCTSFLPFDRHLVVGARIVASRALIDVRVDAVRAAIRSRDRSSAMHDASEDQR
jgi:hypothetical protein